MKCNEVVCTDLLGTKSLRTMGGLWGVNNYEIFITLCTCLCFMILISRQIAENTYTLLFFNDLLVIDRIIWYAVFQFVSVSVQIRLIHASCQYQLCGRSGFIMTKRLVFRWDTFEFSSSEENEKIGPFSLWSQQDSFARYAMATLGILF